jgi:hypothetical protein
LARKLKAAEKKHHKITKDGLIERNSVTGAEKHISRRERDFKLFERAEAENNTPEVKQKKQRKQQDYINPRSENIEEKPRYSAGNPNRTEQAGGMENIPPVKLDSKNYPEQTGETAINRNNIINISPEEFSKLKFDDFTAGIFGEVPKSAKKQKNQRKFIEPPLKNPDDRANEQSVKYDYSAVQFNQTEHININPSYSNDTENSAAETSGEKTPEQAISPDNPDKLKFVKDSKFSHLSVRLKSRNKRKHSKNRIKVEAEKSGTDEKIDIAPEADNIISEKPKDNKVPEKSAVSDEIKPETEDEDVDIISNAVSESPENISEIRETAEETEENPVFESGEILGGDEADNVQSDISVAEESPQTENAEPAKPAEKSSRLQFADAEKIPDGSASEDKKLSRAKEKAEKYTVKLDKAREKLPSKKRLTAVRIFDAETGKPKTRLQFEREIIPPNSRNTLPAPVALIKKSGGGIARIGMNKFHQKVYEAEHENVGIQSAHYIEKAAETGCYKGKTVMRSALNYVRNTPYRTAAELEKKAAEANIKYNYRKVLSENPQLKSNAFSRYMQKRKIKQQYAKKAREAQKAVKSAQKMGESAVGTIKSAAKAIARHPAAAAVLAIILLIIFFLTSMCSMFGGMAGTGFPAVIASTYLAEDSNITQAELDYTEWETDLQIRINHIPAEYPGYHEYRYNTGNTGHNPLELMAYLTAVYGDFQYADIQPVLRQIFDSQYNLEFTESAEIRYNIAGKPYVWRILTINLAVENLSDIFYELLNDEQLAVYELLLYSRGNRQYAGSPFAFDWQSNITSYFGYRISPITGAKQFHKGIDIAAPPGTEITAANTGIVTAAGFDGSFGNYIVIKSVDGIETKYAHCSELLVSAGDEIEQGGIIALVGSTGDSTGNHLHYEVLKSGEYLNPIFFSFMN